MPVAEYATDSATETVDLSKYDNSWYQPGRGVLTRLLWHYVNALVLQNPLNISSALKVAALRAFGAKVGEHVNIKPGVNVKYPWNVQIDDYAWIGERAWLDSLAPIHVGAHACVSQDAYLCTGNHDWSDPKFELRVQAITVEEGAWVGARATVLAGVQVASHSVVTAGSIVSKSTEPYTIYTGNPAVAVKKRFVSSKTKAKGSQTQTP